MMCSGRCLHEFSLELAGELQCAALVPVDTAKAVDCTAAAQDLVRGRDWVWAAACWVKTGGAAVAVYGAQNRARVAAACAAVGLRVVGAPCGAKAKEIEQALAFTLAANAVATKDWLPIELGSFLHCPQLEQTDKPHVCSIAYKVKAQTAGENLEVAVTLTASKKFCPALSLSTAIPSKSIQATLRRCGSTSKKFYVDPADDTNQVVLLPGGTPAVIEYVTPCDGVAYAAACRAYAEKSPLPMAFPDACEFLPWVTTHDVAAARSGEASAPVAVPAFAVRRQLPADLNFRHSHSAFVAAQSLFRVLGAVTRQFAATPITEPDWRAVSIDRQLSAKLQTEVDRGVDAQGSQLGGRPAATTTPDKHSSAGGSAKAAARKPTFLKAKKRTGPPLTATSAKRALHNSENDAEPAEPAAAKKSSQPRPKKSTSGAKSARAPKSSTKAAAKKAGNQGGGGARTSRGPSAEAGATSTSARAAGGATVLFRATALATYTRRSEKELSFREGDVVDVVVDDEAGWYTCVLGSQKGYAAVNWLKRIDSDVKETVTAKKAKPKKAKVPETTASIADHVKAVDGGSDLKAQGKAALMGWLTHHGVQFKKRAKKTELIELIEKKRSSMAA